MTTIIKEDGKLILEYESYGDVRWIRRNYSENKPVSIMKTFYFKEEDLIDKNEEETDEFDNDEFERFAIGELVSDYYVIKKEVLNIKNNLYIQKDIKLDISSFVAYSKISVFKQIDRLVKEDIFIGGDSEPAIPESDFQNLLSNFPNYTEIRKYADARVSVVLRNYFDTAEDSESKYKKYMDKKPSKKGVSLKNLFKDGELNKYRCILMKLEEMVASEDSYNERQWQREILEILILIFPKYIFVFDGVRIKDNYNGKTRELDYLLLDSSGNVDIVEIKKPFRNCIITKNQYRDNFIPLRELSGTVMQIEKYIYYLNRWAKDGEDHLTTKYKNQLPNNFNVKITNPGGIIIMGRETGLTDDQLHDFEIVKRKYKNIVDIITYDDLLKRVKSCIEQFERE